ncbi:unnamed protein product [Litomosoides sigmodontis]|uniref:Uncharacterized protein n=1 Tax=Litomosoides sigmodontis TaxID=42156 RepID=A0A3P6U1T9_LITSI|nr:unnamed protein product [Litomosoides sigmodontis]
MLKQRKLDEALRAGAASRRVHVDKLMASTIHTLINYNIEFTPASTSQNTVEDHSLKYILLKPENEPTKEVHVINNIQLKKVAKFGTRKLQHEHGPHNNDVKQNTEIRKFVRKKKSGTIERRQRKER